MTDGKPQTFAVGVVQMRMTADPQENLADAAAGIRKAAADGANLVCLPELFRSLYFCQSEENKNFDLAEPVVGPTTDALGALARELQVALIVPIFERRTAGIYHNSVVVIDLDGRQTGLYRKMHIPDDPLYYEKYYFTPGDLGFCAFETHVTRVAPLICWDQWFPEGARLAALAGASLLVYPTAIGWHPAEKDGEGHGQLDAWKTVQRAHAISNGVYVVAVNRVGHEGATGSGIQFWGHSFVCDPFGKVLAEASETESEVMVVECDHAKVEATRRSWPFLRDRRVDAYGSITERFLDPK